jgi:hypothetical protein
LYEEVVVVLISDIVAIILDIVIGIVVIVDVIVIVVVIIVVAIEANQVFLVVEDLVSLFFEIGLKLGLFKNLILFLIIIN